MKRVVLPIAILTVTAAVCYVLLNTRPVVEVAPVQPSVTTIRTMVVEQQTITLSVSSRGKVQPAVISELSAVVGGPVIWISPALVAGGYFEAGEVVLKIDPSDYETALQRSDATRMQARAEATHADLELDRLIDLAARGLASQSELQNAKRSAAVAASRLLDAQAGIHQAELNLSRTQLTSPFNSIVSERKIELGQFVATGQSVASLFGADIVEVRLPLANRQIGFLNLPPAFRNELAIADAPDVILKGFYGGKEHRWHGKLVRTEAGIDASNNTVQVIVRVDQRNQDPKISGHSGKIIPLPIGLFVQAEITGQTIDNIISLPRHVIRNNNQVLVASPENTLHFREVDILRLENERVLIKGGLRPGERICLSPLQAVVDGMPIRSIDDMET